MRSAYLAFVAAVLVAGCSSGDPPAPDASPEAAKRIEAEIKAAQSKEAKFRRGTKGQDE
jgi:hypothetical protein